MISMIFIQFKLRVFVFLSCKEVKLIQHVLHRLSQQSMNSRSHIHILVSNKLYVCIKLFGPSHYLTGGFTIKRYWQEVTLELDSPQKGSRVRGEPA